MFEELTSHRNISHHPFQFPQWQKAEQLGEYYLLGTGWGKFPDSREEI